jgi:hypothetical protein
MPIVSQITDALLAFDAKKQAAARLQERNRLSTDSHSASASPSSRGRRLRRTSPSRPVGGWCTAAYSPGTTAPPPQDRESSDGGSGSAFVVPLEEEEERVRAGVLGMPGRCSHENGTEEERSGEGRNRWNGDGDVGGKKENGEAGAKDGEWPFGLNDEGRSRRRRRGVDTAEEGRDGEAGIAGIGPGICALVGLWWWWGAGFYGARAAQQRQNIRGSHSRHFRR